MSFFGGVISRKRLQDEDGSWLGLPGFDHCATTA